MESTPNAIPEEAEGSGLTAPEESEGSGLTAPEESESVPTQPLRDGDATAQDPSQMDPAQAEWDRTAELDSGSPAEESDSATGGDPAEIPDAADEIPAEDLPSSESQPETQGADPVIAELGEEGEGDLTPEDL